ncbi:Uma2 family endonuclease [Catellatospora aurea]|uniref:Uma2 family endonuclease n=1 Tax=Catellatospora aurea TaxID=1337874 RepID=A0ABW2GS36_9ACTN
MTSAAAAEPARLQPGVRSYTVADLRTLPEGSPQCELIDGSIIVAPSSTGSHNLLRRWIAQVLEDANPGTEFVVGTGQPVTIDDQNEPWPDIVVHPAAYLDDSPIPVAGVQLVAEVVSPTSALRDTEIKRRPYARAGVPVYWVIVQDQDAATIALAEMALEGTEYRYITHYTTGLFRTEQPWPVEIDLPAMAMRMARYRKPSADVS